MIVARPGAAVGPAAVERIADAEAFGGLPANEWDALVLAAPRPSPFMLHAWLHEWLRHYGDEGEAVVLVSRRDGRLAGALPLFCTRRLGLRVLAFVGTHQSALGDLLLRDPDDGATAQALVRAAASHPHDLADLFGLPSASVLAATDAPLRLVERVEAPVLELGDGWESVYRAKTDSKKRNLHRRRRRQLSEQGSRLEVVRAQTIDDLRPALEDAFRLHELRWAGRPDGSGFATERGKAFNRAVLERLSRQGVARIVTLKLDGRPIAFHYWFSLGGRMYVFRLAFDPGLARFSPGLVNTLDALEWAADERLERVEYLGGGERYKLELADRLEPLHQAIGLAATPQGELVVRARLRAIATRRRLKRSPRLRRLYFEGLAPVRRALARARRANASQ